MTAFEPAPAASLIMIRAHAHVAQLAEHVLGKDEVISSILIVGSRQQDRSHFGFLMDNALFGRT
jgi:hypothetical protein